MVRPCHLSVSEFVGRFLAQIFIEHLLCTRHCSRHWNHSPKSASVPAFWGCIIQWGRWKVNSLSNDDRLWGPHDGNKVRGLRRGGWGGLLSGESREQGGGMGRLEKGRLRTAQDLLRSPVQ